MKRVSSRILAFVLALTVVTTSVELPVMATEVNTEVVETEVVETEVVETEVIETEVVETEVVETGVVETEAVETEVVETEETTETETDSWDGVTEEFVYEADNYTVTFKLTGAWDGDIMQMSELITQVIHLSRAGRWQFHMMEISVIYGMQ